MRIAMSIASLGIPTVVLGLCCAPLSATDDSFSPDDAQDPGTQLGTVGASCSAVIDKCGWTALECSSDPDCAHWYGCVLDCHPNHGLQGCFDGCASAASPTNGASGLQKCLLEQDAGGCGTNLDAGPKKDSDAPTAQESAAPQDVTPLNWATCEECVWGACQAQITACTTVGESPPDCTDYKYLYSACAKSETEAAFEKCMLEADKKASEAHHGFAESGAMACVAAGCSALCVPVLYRACVECSRAKCADAYDAWLNDAMAQDLSWCRNGCEGGEECLAECKNQYGDGAGVLSAILACQVQKCPSCGL